MNNRPRIHPNVFASIAESAPDRVRKKLDKEPTVAHDWVWALEGTTWTIDAGSEKVTLEIAENVIAKAEQVGCSCLLSPRCFHVLSVLSVLELADAIAVETPIAQETADDDEEKLPAELSEDQKAAARSMWNAAAAILATGARAAGTLLQSQLLRAIHECRSVGLHRLGSAGVRVMQNIRWLREEHDAFSREDLLADFAELLKVAWTLSRGETIPTQEWMGVAKRKFTPAGSLRLTGLFTEPILTRSGYSGVATYLLGDEDSIFSFSNVRPGTSERIAEAYQTGADLGGLSIPHQTLNRQGLLVQKATRSTDGRLGNSKDCRAVTTESAGWNAEAVARRFAIPLVEQVNRVFQFDGLPVTEQPGGWDLLFLEGMILGSDGENLFFGLNHDQGVTRLRIANDHPKVPFRENLEMLARVPGLHARFIARMLPSSPGDALALAFAPLASEESSPTCTLPDKWQGHANLGIDKLERRFFSSAEKFPHVIAPKTASAQVSDGLDFVRRRLQAVALGGRHALPTGRVGTTVSEARTMDTNLQPAAAALLKGLAQCAIESRTDLLGVRFPPDPTHLAERWLAGAVYEETARRHFQKWGWMKSEI